MVEGDEREEEEGGGRREVGKKKGVITFHLMHSKNL